MLENAYLRLIDAHELDVLEPRTPHGHVHHHPSEQRQRRSFLNGQQPFFLHSREEAVKRVVKPSCLALCLHANLNGVERMAHHTLRNPACGATRHTPQKTLRFSIFIIHLITLLTMSRTLR